MLKNKQILLIITGGISAYKTLDLIRILKKCEAQVTCVLTKGGAQFVTPLSVAALSGNKVFDDLWSLTDETKVGHIRLSREHDLIVVAPATADIMAKMAHGMAGDIASTVLLATNKPVLLAPAMNPTMWANDATQNNVSTLKKRGVLFVGPNEGDTACGETGIGRMSEPEEILEAVKDFFFEGPLKGFKALVTAGPTYEEVDPVRFIGNRSSGKQGYAIAEALLEAGAEVTLVSGPTNLNDVQGAKMVHIENAREMLAACEAALPCDICVCSAAVSDWRTTQMQLQKIKKQPGSAPPTLELTENPDILGILSKHPDKRPTLVVGFAAETENIEQHALSKLEKKGCDWIMANLVGKDKKGQEKAFGADKNKIYFYSQTKNDPAVWKQMSKKCVAEKLVVKIEKYFS